MSTVFMAFFSKHFKTMLMAVVALFAFSILMKGCQPSPNRIWNWTRTRIINRGDGNWFDWRKRDEVTIDDVDDVDEDGRRRWNLQEDNSMQVGTSQEEPTKEKGMLNNDTMTWVLVIGGGLLAVWFLVLTPEQRERLNIFKSQGGGTVTGSTPEKVVPVEMRADLIEAYCLLFDHIKDNPAKKALNDVVLPKVMTADQDASSEN